MAEKDTEQQKFQFFYQHLSEDIERTKRRQWTIPYYMLLLFAAIVGIHEAGVKSCEEKFLLSTLAFIVCLFGIWHVFDVHFVQTRYRAKLHNLTNDNPDFIYDYTRPDKSDLTIKYYLPQFTFFFSGIIIAGFSLLLLYFYQNWLLTALCLIVLIFYCYQIYRKKKEKLIQQEKLLKEANTKKSKG